MNLLDGVLIVILGYCLIRGIFRGLIKEVSAIVGVLGGYYAAYTYYPSVARLLAHWISNPGYLNIISFLLLFLVVFWAVSIAGVILKYLMNIAFLGWTDRISGALFGALKAMLINMVLILVLTTFLPRNAHIIKSSRGAHGLMRFSAYLVKAAPKEMKNTFEAKMKALNNSWQRH
jgi:membrane protein required for colicin V production